MTFKDQNQRYADKLAVFLGLEIKRNYPEVPELARLGKTQKEIAGHLLESGFDYISSLDVMKHAVGYSLKGNSNRNKGEIYTGTISLREYNDLTRNHRTSNLEKAMTSNGDFPWNKDEERRLIAYSKQEEFKYRNAPSPTKIAKALNEEFNHHRTRKSVFEKLKRLTT